MTPDTPDKRLDQDIDDELRFHLEMRAASLERSGMSPEAAEHTAYARFGGIDHIRDECREITMNFFDILLQDLRYASRTLWKNRGFTGAALASLILGIGATTTIFSLVHGVLLKPLPFRDSERLVAVWTSWKDYPGHYKATGAHYALWREQKEVFEQLAAIHYYLPVTWTTQARSEQLEAQRVTANFFPLLGVKPIMGRNFAPEEQTGNSAQVILISQEFWQSRFGGDPAIVGKSLSIDGSNQTIIGVMPAGMRFFRLLPLMSHDPSIWRPHGPFLLAPGRPGDVPWLHVIGRLKAGVTLEKAQAAMNTVAARLEQQDPKSNEGIQILVESIRDALAGDSRTPLLVLMGAVFFVLLIANANVAGLLLARATARQREFAVRAAMGGKRRRLIRQLLTESILLSAIGGVAGFMFAVIAVPTLVRLTPLQMVPSSAKVEIDFAVLSFSVVASICTGLIFGVAPALQATNINVNDGLQADGRSSSAGRSSQRIRSFLVAAEIAVATVLLVGAGLLVQTFARLTAIDPGFTTHHVVSVQVHMPRFKYAVPTGKRIGKTSLSLIAVNPDLPARVDRILNKMRAIPGVELASVASTLPLIVAISRRDFDFEGAKATGQRPNANYNAVSSDYFRTLGIPLLNGRYFAPSDTNSSEWVAIVSRTTAQRYWPNESPVGKQITVQDPTGLERTRQIVGVVGDVKRTRLEGDPSRLLYVPYEQQPDFYGHTNYWDRHYPHFVLRTKVDPSAVVRIAKRVITETDADIPITEVKALGEIVAAHTERPRFLMTLLTSFAGIALVLAAVGIYGVMSYSVTRRTREIGIRRALGAPASRVLGMILKHGFALALLGLTIGLGASYYLTRFIATWLYGVQATDGSTFAIVSLILFGATMLACFIPARRAARLDPMKALRHE